MSAPALEIEHDRRRAAKQLPTMAIGLLVMLAMTYAGVWVAFRGEVVAIVVGVVLALLGLLASLVAGVSVWTSVRVLVGRAGPVLVVDSAGITWQGILLPWQQISGVRLESGPSMSFAAGTEAGAERAAERVLAAGGVNDGRRHVVVTVRDRAAVADPAGDAGSLIAAGASPGSGVLRMVLDAVTDADTFARAAVIIEQEAARRGIRCDVP